MLNLFLALSIALMSPLAFSISESDNYAQHYASEVSPFWDQHGETGLLKVTPDIDIAYTLFVQPNPKGHIVILEGWTESMRKYAEITYDLSKLGFNIYLFDWRGQGQSSRMVADRDKSYIRDYSEYMEDLGTFVAKVVRTKTSEPLVALGHSMGANILSRFVIEEPNIFSRAIFCSPMLDMKTGNFPEAVAWLIAKAYETVGLGDSYVFGHGPYVSDGPNIVTSSEIRRNTWLNYKSQHREIITNGATFSWLRASLDSTMFMKERSHEMKIPVMMFQAGNDLYVETEGQDEFCREAKQCIKIVFPGAKHEILNETDVIRNKAIREILDFVLIGP